MNLSQMNLSEMLNNQGIPCSCDKIHACELGEASVGSGVVKLTPDILLRHGMHRPFVVCDEHTRAAALPQVENALQVADLPYTVFSFGQGHIEPDESTVGALAMAFDHNCDSILAVGSGVINDCCKVLAHLVNLPMAVVGTAPSMDGYASGTASMIQNWVKVSLNTGCPRAIIADTAIMKEAPMRMLQAGYGDMIAKYCAICEWRIASLVTGEYYCDEIAQMVRSSLRQVTAASDLLTQRDEEAVGHVAEGLILAGVAMAYAGMSRPASGEEHYFSHMWEMMRLDRGQESELHGIQVGVGTLLTLKMFDWLKTVVPSRERAQAMMRAFDERAWRLDMTRIFGKAGPAIIAGEEQTYHKNNPDRHAQHLDVILSCWDDIREIMVQELPDTRVLEAQMRRLSMPMTPGDINLSIQDVKDAWYGSREIRDKYLISSLVWDLGLMDEAVGVLTR